MTYEPQPSPRSDAAVADAADTTERFERGDDMADLYARMRPDQRTAIAGEFIRLLTLAGDDKADEFRQHFQRKTQITKDRSNELLPAEQVASVDSYVRQRHPEMIRQMLEHPVTVSALEIPGVETPDTQDETPLEDKIMPTENVATSGAAYATSWEMMELGGEEANRLAEAPHEQAVTPQGEIDREQDIIENEGEEGERPSTEPPERNT